MKKVKWLYLLVAAGLIVGVAPIGAAEGEKKAEPPPTAEKKAEKAVDEDWLNTVWTQVDDMVKEEEFKLQETVTVAGVRGAEAEDNILDKLYYKGGKRYPSQDKLTKAIETLKKSIEKNPKAETVPKQQYFIAQCYEKLGQVAQAKTYYTQVAKSKTTWATKAQERLTKLTATE